MGTLPLLPLDRGVTVLQTPALGSPELTTALGILAVVVLLWGLERYRTTFSKAELLVSLALSGGIALMAFAPTMFNRIGALLNIEQRPLVIALLSNVTLTVLVLWLFARTRSNHLTIGDLTRSLTVERAPTVETPEDPVAFVVIPAYNEGAAVADVVASLPERAGGYAIQAVVVSDGSTDDTATVVADTRAMVVEHPINQGQGGALQTGFAIAQRNGADAVVTMDADGQHPVEYLQELLDPIATDRADFVVGSRYVGDDRSDNGPARQAGIRVFTALINLVAKLDVTDCTNGYRAIRGSALSELTLTEERFSAPELLIEARKNALRIEEVPVTIRERDEGESKKPTLGYAFGLTRTIFVTWLR
ncbi:glycosyltransferase family 2 protein [Halorhabdus salina]|uniref:glycosyltransferase family 2 protein n=1 Tax=Halorhabdus salina TaxID=2750670 RepID=UPI0015EFAFAF|nr:glycosyltransferase family 2 protein [Halorhabdus salina]